MPHSSKRGNSAAAAACHWRKVQRVMGKRGTLHSGGKRGPLVHSVSQARAFALNEARRACRRR